MEARETSFNDMQTVKRRFFAMRNGIIADVLRRNGSPFKIIFGLNLPQIAEIASETPHNRDIAERLWANSTTRESMLIAPMLVDAEHFTIDDARQWVDMIPAREVADILCLKLLRNASYAFELAVEFATAHKPMTRYTGLRLMFNLASKYPKQAIAVAKERIAVDEDAGVLALARALEDECEFLLED